MTETPTPPDVDTPPDESSMAVANSRYSSLTLEDGDLVIFDRDGTDAWLQSDLAVDVSP